MKRWKKIYFFLDSVKGEVIEGESMKKKLKLGGYHGVERGKLCVGGWCRDCAERREYEKWFRRWVVKASSGEAHLYLNVLGWMEWVSGARPGEWVFAGLKKWMTAGYISRNGFYGAVKGLKAKGFIDYSGGVKFGKGTAEIAAVTKVRRRTFEEMKAMGIKGDAKGRGRKLEEYVEAMMRGSVKVKKSKKGIIGGIKGEGMAARLAGILGNDGGK